MPRTVEDIGLQQWVLVTSSGRLIRCGSKQQAKVLAEKLMDEYMEPIGLYHLEMGYE